MNWYVYCTNDPFKYVDPTGLYGIIKTPDGRVYVEIDPGDTFWQIGVDQGKDGNAYLKLGIEDPDDIQVGEVFDITGMWDEGDDPTIILLSKNRNLNWYNDLPRDPDELNRMYKDKSTSTADKKRIRTQQKKAGQANKQKRGENSKKIEVEDLTPTVPAPAVPAPRSAPTSANPPLWLGVLNWLISGCSGITQPGSIPSTCFTSGTLIKTDKGLIPIIDIKVGDIVYSYDAETEEMGYKRVVNLFLNSSIRMVYIAIDGEVIKATPEHPFYVDGIGWIIARDLTIGDEVKLSSQKTAIILVRTNVRK